MKTLKFGVPFALAIMLAACGDGTPDEGAEAETSVTDEADSEDADATADEAEDKADESEAAEPAKKTAALSINCANGKTIFSCTAENGKEIRVCDTGGGRLTYRFGAAKGTPELELTSNADWAHVPYSGGGESQIRFSNGATDYIVYSRVVRTNFEPGEPNNPEFSDGVLVMNKGKRMGGATCKGDAESVDITALSELADSKDDGLFAEPE